MPCDETGACPYDPSPGGEGALDPVNELAVWAWERLRTVGPVLWELVDLRLTPAEAGLLIEQLDTLARLHAQAEAERQGQA